MELIQTVLEAGIVGAGGAGFPTHVKLDAKADCFIVNAAECEPLIETDKYLCRTFPEKVVGGAVIAAAHLGAKRTVIAIKEKYRPEIEALKEAIQSAGASVEIFGMPTYYPAGDEQCMVQMVTGRSVPERGIPLEVGSVVSNVGTMMNLFDAVRGQGPVCEKYLSVTGAVREPIMLKVPIGTSIADCIEKAGPLTGDWAVILGGPMMGKYLRDPEEIERAVVTKTTGNLLVLPRDHYLIRRSQVPIERLKVQAKSACIQCVYCTQLCPRYMIGHRMRPHMIMRNVWLEDTITDDAAFEAAYGEAVNCCDCGLCELFSCPMQLSPRQINIYMKQRLKERGIRVPKVPEPQAYETVDLHRVPTERLIPRLGLAAYGGQHAQACCELSPDRVYIPFSQHIGKPAVPCRAVGERIKKGELLARADGNLSANIHASISGIVTKIDVNGAQIEEKEDGV